MNNNEFQVHTEKIEKLVQRVTQFPDGEASTAALDLLQSLMDLHGAAIGRFSEMLSGSEAGRASLARLSSDPLICGLLVLYGVHPHSFEERVVSAIEKADHLLVKKGGHVELLGIAENVVRVKIRAGQGCGSSAETLKNMVDQSILETAPETLEIVAEGTAAGAFVPLDMLQPAAKKEKAYEESAA
jgi:Fe-S cluster biogenesis protein NfuA